MIQQNLILVILPSIALLCVAHPINQDLFGSSQPYERSRRQIITADVGNCGGNHSNTIGGREKRQIITTDVSNCGGQHSNKMRRAVHTDPNNIKVTVNSPNLVPQRAQNTPLGNNRGNSILLQQPFNFNPPTLQSQSKENGIGSSILGDSGNVGGIHQDNIAIGGIQNFGGRYNDLIAKLTGDTNNKGGVHSDNVAIGGILNF